MINMKFPIIDLKDVAKAYLQKGVYKHSGEGTDPSIILPTIQLQYAEGNKMQFGILHYYYPAPDEEFVGADGTKYGVWVPVPHPNYEGSLTEGVKMVWSSSNFAPAPFPGTNAPTLFVYEVDLTVAKTFSLGFTNPSVRCVKDGQTVTETFPTFWLTVDFTFNGDNGLVKYCDFPLDMGDSFKIDDGKLALGDKITTGTIEVPPNFEILNINNTGAFVARTGASARSLQHVWLMGTKDAAVPDSPAGIYGETADRVSGIHINAYNGAVNVGLHRSYGTDSSDKCCPIYVLDKSSAPEVWVMGKQLEWKTVTIDGVQMKVLAAKA